VDYLGAGATIQGSAASGSSVTYTLTGDEISAAGVDSFKKLAQGQLLTNAATTPLYTVPASTMALVKAAKFSNNAVTAQAVSLYIDGSDAAHRILSVSIPAGGSMTLHDDGFKVYDANGAQTTTQSLTFTGDATGTGTGGIALTVVALQGRAVSASAPSTNNGLVWNGSAWTPTAVVQSVTAADASVTLGGTAPAVTIATGRPDQIFTAHPPTADVNFNSQKITNLANGVATTDAINLGQLTAAVEGRANKDPALWGTTANVTLSGLATQGGGEWTGALTAGQRVLVKNQSASADDGVYLAAAGAWTRSLDTNAASEVTNASVLVLMGATLAGDTYTQTATVTTLGTDPQTWVQTGDGAVYSGDGSSITLTGTTFSLTSVITGGGPIGSTSVTPVITWNAKGQLTAVTSATITPAAIGAQPVDATLTALAAADWVANAVPIGSGADTVSQIVFAANTFPARGSTGNLVAKTITNAGLAFVAAADAAAETALLNPATTSLQGMLSASDKTKLNYLPNFVTDYGADPTGATDIAAAVTAAVAAGVSRVFVPAGTYKCATTGTHVITTHLVFQGAGRKDTIFKTNHATNTAFQWRNWGGGFTNCGFDTLVARTGGYCVDFPNSTQAGGGSGSLYGFMRECDIYAQYVAIHSGDHEHLFDDIEIRYPGLTLTGQGGILVDGAAVANDKRISNLLIQGGNTAGQFGVQVTQCASLTFTGRNDIINAANALDIIPGNGQSVPSIYASNTFFDNSIRGLNVAPTGTGAVLRCHFTQCWFSSCTVAGIVLNSANVAGVDFLNCDVFGNAVGLEALAAQDWSMRGSRIAGNTTAGIRTTAAATHAFSIEGNAFGTIASPQFGANANSINVQAGTYARYTIFNNRGTETDTVGITDNGSVTLPAEKLVRDNLGTGLNEYASATTAGQTLSATTLADIGGLSFPIARPNLSYLFDAFIPANIASTSATGLSLAINAPAGATLYAQISSAASGAANKEAYFTQINTSQTGILTTSGFTAGVLLRGRVVAGTATSHTGTVQVRGAIVGTVSTLAGSATINLGSWLRAAKIG